MTTSLGRIIIYTKKLDAMIAFYCTHFDFEAVQRDGDRIVELTPRGPGASLMLHPASKGRKEGQSLVKLVFDVPDVSAFCASAAERGLTFGTIHRADGYEFANAKDPSNNSVSVSSRAFAPRPGQGTAQPSP